MPDRIFLPTRGNLTGIQDEVVRSEIRKLWEHHALRSGQIGDPNERHVTLDELEALRRQIKTEPDPNQGYRATTLGGDGGAPSTSEAAPTTTGAPVSATYVLMDHNAALPQHRKLTAGAGITLTDGGPAGDATVAADVMGAIGDQFVRWCIPVSFASGASDSNGIPMTSGQVGVSAPSATRIGQVIRSLFRTSSNAASVGNANGGHGSGGGAYWRGTGTNLGGFYVRWIFGIEEAPATIKFFIGLQNSSTAGTTATIPSNSINCIGLGVDAGDANLSLLCNDAAGACTKLDLGADFPAAAGEVYTLDVTCSPNDSEFRYRVARLGQSAVSGSLTTDIPDASLFLMPYVFVCNGTSGTPGFASLAFIYLGSTQPYLT